MEQYESDYSFYRLRSSASIYLLYIISVASEYICQEFVEIFNRAQTDISQAYPVVSLFCIENDIKSKVIVLISKRIFMLKDVFERKGFLWDTVVENELSMRKHEVYLKLIAELEIFGRILRYPRELVIDRSGEIDFEFASRETKQVVKSVTVLFRRDCPFMLDVEFASYNKMTRDFSPP